MISGCILDFTVAAPNRKLALSHGPRDCLGRDFATMLGVFVLASIAQRWRLEPVAGKPPRADGKLVLVVKGSFPAVATERS